MSISAETIRFTTQLFCIATMAAMGLGIKFSDIMAPFRSKLALALILLVNNVAIPLLGFLIIAVPTVLTWGPLKDVAELIIPLHGEQQIGFLLLFLVSGTVLAPTLTKIAGVEDEFGVGVRQLIRGVTNAVSVNVETGFLHVFDELVSYLVLKFAAITATARYENESQSGDGYCNA